MAGAAVAYASLGCTDTTGPAGSLFPALTGTLEAVQLRGRWVGTAQTITLTMNIAAVDSGPEWEGVKPYFPRGEFELVDRSTSPAGGFSMQPFSLQCRNDEVTLTRCMKANEPLKVWLTGYLGDRYYDRYMLRVTSSRSMDGWLHWQTNHFLFTSSDSTRFAMTRVGEATP
jgi:hypothetical protein